MTANRFSPAPSAAVLLAVCQIVGCTTQPNPASPASSTSPASPPKSYAVPASGPFQPALAAWAARERPAPGPAKVSDTPLTPASVGKTALGLKYSYYEKEGGWSRVPTFADLEPQKEGVVHEVGLDIPRREDHFAVKFEGYFQAPQTGVYEFALTSDDGSVLLLGGKMLVDNDGNHAPKTEMGRVRLAEGLHAIEIGYFEGSIGQTLELNVRLPDGTSMPVEGELVKHSHP